MRGRVLFTIVLVFTCAQVKLTATSSIQSIIGTWYDATESDVDPRSNGIAQGAGRCKVTPGVPGSAIFTSEIKLAGDEQICNINKAIPHGAALELVMSCVTEGTHSQERRTFQLLDQAHLRVYSNSSDSFVLTRCPNSELNNARTSESSNEASVPTPKRSASDSSIFLIGYPDEGKVDATLDGCSKTVTSITAWNGSNLN